MTSRWSEQRWLLGLRLLVLTCPLTLTACLLIPTTKKEWVIVKPNREQIESAARQLVCSSFKPIPYACSPVDSDGDGKFDRCDGPAGERTGQNRYDTPTTTRDIRGHNAALGSFKCPASK